MLPASYQFPAGIVLVAVGLLACLAGYRLFRAVLTIYGFVLGALFASSLVAPSNTVAMLVALGVGGLLGALVLYAGYFAGVVLVGAGLGATVLHAAWVQWRGTDPHGLAVILFAVVGGVAAVVAQRLVVILATSFLGAQTVVAGVLGLLTRPAKPRVGDAWVGHLGMPTAGRHWPFFAWLALGVVGTLVQLGLGKGRSGRKR